MIGSLVRVVVVLLNETNVCSYSAYVQHMTIVDGRNEACFYFVTASGALSSFKDVILVEPLLLAEAQ